MALGLLLHVNKTSLPSLHTLLLLFLVLVCILFFGVSPLALLLPSFFFYVYEVKVTLIIITFFFKWANLFTIIAPSCNFSFSFGLWLFSSASPCGFTPSFLSYVQEVGVTTVVMTFFFIIFFFKWANLLHCCYTFLWFCFWFWIVFMSWCFPPCGLAPLSPLLCAWN